MSNKLYTLRPVITQPQDEFGKLLSKVLSPARPLQSEEYLKGREQQLADIKKAVYQPGRHVLIHGLRGVGKSSLAQTAAYSLSRQADPIVIGCDRRSSFGRVIREVFEEAENSNPKVRQKIKESGASFSRLGIGLNTKVTTTETAPSDAGSVNEAVRFMQYLCQAYAEEPVVVIDEFDQIVDKVEQEHFTNFIKQVSDKHVPARFIFCGIGESADAIMKAHGSADRYFHTVELGQLPYEARYDIVTSSADTLGIVIDDETVMRIARISDGFPHYVHIVSEKLYWRVYEAENSGVVTPELFEGAMGDASMAMDMKLRGPYEKATQKYNNDYEGVLWAVADGHELQRRSTDIYGSYIRIMSERKDEALDRTKFNARINALKRTTHGKILTGNRQGWYEFSEKMIRGYVRLRAEQAGVLLDADLPKVPRRSSSI